MKDLVGVIYDAGAGGEAIHDAVARVAIFMKHAETVAVEPDSHR